MVPACCQALHTYPSMDELFGCNSMTRATIEADVSISRPPAQEFTCKPHVQGTSRWELLSIQEAFDSLKLMADSEPPSVDNLMYVLQKCRNEENPDHAKHMHLLICSNGLEAHASLGNHLVPMFVRCGTLFHSQQVFHKLARPNSYSWTSLIQGYTDCAEFQHAFGLFQKMQEHGVHSSGITFLALIKACGRLKLIGRGYELHAEIVKGGFEEDPFLGSTLVDMYARCSSLREAQVVFDKLPARDVVSWNTLIAGYADCGLGEEALNCLEKMQQAGISPDAFTFVYTLKACGSVGAIDWGRGLHNKVVEEGYESDSFLGNTLVDIYGKFGLFIEARAVFDELPAQDVVPWTALIAGYADYGLDKEVLKCYEQMQLKGVLPNAVTYACIVKACSSVGASESGQVIHAEIAKEGYESEPRVGNVLVDFYANCSCFAEALCVFDELLVQDVVAWTALMGGYVEHGLGEDALNFLEQMLKDGVSPNPVTMICSLKACGSIRSIDAGREVHHQIAKKAFDSDPSVGNGLVDMYAKCGSLAEARLVFDILPARNVVSWNTLINACFDYGLDEEALDCLEQMELEGLSPNSVTFSCSLKCCSSLGAIDRGRALHTEIIKEGLEKDPSVGNTTVVLYAKCALLVEAQEAFDELPIRDVVSWTALIGGYSEHGCGEKALQCLEQMQLERVSPNAMTLDCSLKACCSLGGLDRVQQIHSELTEKGFNLDPFVGNSLVAVYVKCGFLAEGRAVFDELLVQDIVSRNALIAGYAASGSFGEAKELFDKLPVQDVVSWTTLIAGYVDQGFDEEALYYLKHMQLKGVSPDAATFSSGVKACGSLGIIDRGQELHIEIAKEGFERDPFLGNSLLDMYAKCGLLAEAQDLFDDLPVRDVVAWTALTAGYSSHGFKEQVQDCLKQMQLEGVFPNVVFWNAMIMSFAETGEIEKSFSLCSQMQEQGLIPDNSTMVSALKACGKAAALASGKRLHAQINRVSELDNAQGTALIDMYGKCGSMVDAHLLFDAMPTRNLVRWNALIGGYAHLGESGLVFHLYESMRMEGIQPNETTFLSILTVCSHVGLVGKGERFFEAMCKTYDIAPSIKHFNCMANLLGRAGHLNDAVEMLEKLPFQPDLVTWRTLLGASRLCNDICIGIHAYDEAMALDINYSVPFILLSNMYADAHMWEDANMF